MGHHLVWYHMIMIMSHVHPTESNEDEDVGLRVVWCPLADDIWAAAMRGLVCAFAVLLAVLCQVGEKSRPLHPWWEKHESIGTWTACHFQKGFSNMDGQNHHSRRLQIYTVYIYIHINVYIYIYICISTYNYFWHLLDSLCLLREDHHAAG